MNNNIEITIKAGAEIKSITLKYPVRELLMPNLTDTQSVDAAKAFLTERLVNEVTKALLPTAVADFIAEHVGEGD